MSLLDRLNINLDTVNANEVEESMKSGGIAAIGLHHAVLDGCREVQANSGSQGYELRFKILAGPSKGCEVKESLWVSEKEKAKQRVLLFMHRLGLLTKIHKAGQDHYAPVAGKSELSQCIGKEVVIDVKEHEAREYQGKTYTDARLSFEGVLELGDKRCEKVPRGKPGDGGTSAGVTVPGGGGGGGQAAAGKAVTAPAQQTFDDI